MVLQVNAGDWPPDVQKSSKESGDDMFKKRSSVRRDSGMRTLLRLAWYSARRRYMIAEVTGLLTALVLFFSAPHASWNLFAIFDQPGQPQRASLLGEFLLSLLSSVVAGGGVWVLLRGTSQRLSDDTTQVMAPADQTVQKSFRASSPLLPPSVPLVTISLLQRVQVRLHLPEGRSRDVPLRRGEQGIRLILLAYIAWRRGKPVERDKILTHVFARGRRRDMDPGQLSEAFDAAKKFLRADLKRAIHAVNTEAGRELISEQGDFFQHEPGFYRLHPSCRVDDLERIDQLSQTIRQARKEGRLDEKGDGSIPQEVVETCRQLLQAYTGNFLEELIEKFPDAFGSWVREPVTYYRDCYLEALWLLATYESALGQQCRDESLSSEQREEQRRHHQGKAAQLYYDYALFAVSSRVDSKLKFAYRAGRDGERVVMSQRAIRRCVALLGMMGETDRIDQVYLMYKDKMSMLSEGQWKPEKETESDVMNAKRRMHVVRFLA